ncbi:hypothetical protein B0H17DRAFT_1079324 [Mycena rosella]|uniref:Uncharacterized protein n=1 Tax=Mycena rosella TaxID=1033263 RepID=A0AAD7D7I5_MYCRO|nr:hypothetical protein B0H17DRAFT_1079324 [Mycena rosella]
MTPASPASPVSPAPSSRMSARTSDQRMSDQRMSEQMFMDELYESLLHTTGYETSDTDEAYHPSSSQASAYESESESDALSAPTSPGGFVPYHLPRRLPARIDTRRSTPSLVSSSSRSSQSSSRHEYASPVTPLPLSPEGSQALLPSIEERYPDDDDEFEPRGERGMRMHGGGGASTTLDGMPWPMHKSRVEWAAPKVQEEMQITTELRKPEARTRTEAGAETRAWAAPGPRVSSPTPSDVETVAPRASGAFSRLLSKKPLPDALQSPKSPKAPKSPLSSAQESGFFLDPKAQKAEEKRRKKERMEELARTLKERAQKARDDADKASSKSKEKRTEPVAMYNAQFGLTM